MTDGWRERLWRLVLRHPVSVLAALLMGGALFLAYYGARLSRELVASKALLDAAIFSEAIAEVRTLYTSEVVEVLRGRGVQVTHDYKEHAGAIPLPVTFSMLLGQRIGERRSGESTHLYSPHPFPWRKDGGLRDGFARDAWTRLTRDPTVAFHRFEEIDGRRVLRYARADRMRAACVDCHNTHPESPKTDWKVGDVRGVLEIRLPMHMIEAEGRAGLRGALLVSGAAALAGIAVFALVFGRLRRTREDLERTLGDLGRSHAEVRRAYDELVVARDEARAAGRAKNQFLDNMSHELRTPLNAIIGYSELLAEELEEVGQRPLVGEVAKVRTAALRLGGLVDDVLDFARLDAGEAGLALSTFDVAELVDDVAQRGGAMDEGGAVELRVECAADVGRMHADHTKLRRALAHLLSNARKFTERGRIVLRVAREAVDGVDWVRFAVEDTGIGMTPEQQRASVEPFSQADASTTRRHGGSGLGLALVLRYAQLLRGDLAIESEPGRGSTFTLRIPAHVRPPGAPPA